MNIIQAEDKKKYTKSSETNSIEFFISRDSIIFIYFTYILHTAFYILYVYIYKWQCQVVSFEFSVIPKRVLQEFRRKLRGYALLWSGEKDSGRGWDMAWALIDGEWAGYLEKAMAPHSSTLAWKIPWMEEPGRLQSMGSQRIGHDWCDLTSEELDMTERLHFHFSLSSLENEMATHSGVLAWRIPGTPEPGGLPSMGSQRIGHDWSDLAAAAAAEPDIWDEWTEFASYDSC